MRRDPKPRRSRTLKDGTKVVPIHAEILEESWLKLARSQTNISAFTREAVKDKVG